MLDYLRTRAAAMTMANIRERIRAAARELESVAAAVAEADARRRPLADKWTIAEVVDHIAQTQVRGTEELRNLLAGRRPPGPPVYEALRSGAAQWAPWAELLEGLREANQAMVELLAAEPAVLDPLVAVPAPTARTILVVTRKLADGSSAPQIFVDELGCKEYAILQRLHLLDHRTQIQNLRAAL